MKVVGVDIGGTSIKVGLVDEAGEVLQFFEYDTESEKGGRHVLHTLIDQIKANFEAFDAIGISTAGMVDIENGTYAQEAANIPDTKGLPLKATLEEVFRVPVTVENDVNAAALGESAFGIGKQYNDLLYLAYGTGIGGGIVIDSEIYYGADGYAGELGHFVTHAFGRTCGCGKKGCYEQYASTTALVNAAKEIDPAYINGRIIFEKYHAGDEEVKAVVHHWLNEIAVGLASIIHIFNPRTIILGGGVMEQEDILVILRELVKEMTVESFQDVQIIAASLGNKAGLLGAASKHIV